MTALIQEAETTLQEANLQLKPNAVSKTLCSRISALQFAARHSATKGPLTSTNRMSSSSKKSQEAGQTENFESKMRELKISSNHVCRHIRVETYRAPVNPDDSSIKRRIAPRGTHCCRCSGKECRPADSRGFVKDDLVLACSSPGCGSCIHLGCRQSAELWLPKWFLKLTEPTADQLSKANRLIQQVLAGASPTERDSEVEPDHIEPVSRYSKPRPSCVSATKNK